MANESAPNTRTLQIPWLAMVTRADPNWAQDHKLVVEDERRPKVRQDWQRRGPYTP